jgi:hypothetical protein
MKRIEKRLSKPLHLLRLLQRQRAKRLNKMQLLPLPLLRQREKNLQRQQSVHAQRL